MTGLLRSSSFSTSTTNTRSIRSSNVSTVGLGMMSGRAILALGEAVILVAQRFVGRRDSYISSISTPWKLSRSHSRQSLISTSDYAETRSSSSTVPGVGEMSGRAIKALGKVTLRGLDEIQLRLRLSALDPLFPHETRIVWETDDGEAMYEEILDLSRPGVYSARVQKHAMQLLLTQIGFRRITQLIRGLVEWDVGRIQDLLTRLMDPILQIDREPTTQSTLTKAYIRYQDAPEIDPLLPFAAFLLQLSSASVAAHEASTEAGALLLSQLTNHDEFSLTRHLLQTLASVQKPDPPLHRDILSLMTDPSNTGLAPVLSQGEMPADISQWKFPWILSHIAREGAYWDVLIQALIQGTVDERKELLFRIVSSVLSPSFTNSYRRPLGVRDAIQESTDRHFADGFHLACHQGIKSGEDTPGKDPVNLALRFMLHALSSEPDLRVAFIDPNYFVEVIQDQVPSLAVHPIDEAVRSIQEHGLEWYSIAGTAESVERMRLCWELFNTIPTRHEDV